MEERRAQETGREWRAIRRGWCLGDEGFRRELLQQIDGRMGEHNVARRQPRNKIFCHLKQCIIILDKELHEIAHLREFCGPTDKVRNWSRRPVPDENMKSLLAKYLGHSASDNPETNHSDIFALSTGH